MCSLFLSQTAYIVKQPCSPSNRTNSIPLTLAEPRIGVGHSAIVRTRLGAVAV